MTKEQTKEDVLATMKRFVPGTIDITDCEDIEYCMDKKIRTCNDIRNLWLCMAAFCKLRK